MNRFHGAPMVLPATGNKYVHARGGSPSRLRSSTTRSCSLPQPPAGRAAVARADAPPPSPPAPFRLG